MPRKTEKLASLYFEPVHILSHKYHCCQEKEIHWPHQAGYQKGVVGRVVSSAGEERLRIISYTA